MCSSCFFDFDKSSWKYAAQNSQSSRWEILFEFFSCLRYFPIDIRFILFSGLIVHGE